MPKIDGRVLGCYDAVICHHNLLHLFGDEIVEGANLLLHEASGLGIPSNKHVCQNKGIDWNTTKEIQASTGSAQLTKLTHRLAPPSQNKAKGVQAKDRQRAVLS